MENQHPIIHTGIFPMQKKKSSPWGIAILNDSHSIPKQEHSGPAKCDHAEVTKSIYLFREKIMGGQLLPMELNIMEKK